jgi:inner membrane protein
MDNLTHSLVGALLGQMGLKRMTGLAMPTLIIAANIPDIDAVAVLLGGHQHLALRRGLTHGPIAMVVLPWLLWGAMLWFDAWQGRRGKRPEKRLPVHKGWLLALAYIGCLTHPALDWCNSYGIRLLEPFSHKWFYGDVLFIIDVWIWGALIAGVWLSLRRERCGASDWQRPAWISFMAVCAYIFANGLITGHAATSAKSDFYRVVDGKRVETGMVIKAVANPVPVWFWRREVIIMADRRSYSVVPYSIISGLNNVEANELLFPINDKSDLKKELGGNSDRDAFLFWSRLPYLEFEQRECSAVPCPIDSGRREPTLLRDARFHEDIVKERFSVPYILPPLKRDEAR